MKSRQRRSRATFACGHPRTPENTRIATSRGRRWSRCRTCNNKYMRAYMRRRARQRLLQRIASLSKAAAKAKQP